MPLPDWVRKKPSVASPAAKVPSRAKLSPPLEGVTLNAKQLSECKDTSTIYTTKSVKEVLNNPRLLNFFVRFLETKLAANAVHFLLDVRSFELNFFNTDAVVDGNGFSAIFSPDIPNSESVESFDSGIVSPSTEKDPSGTKSQAMTQMALAIYKSYVSPEAPMELGFLPAEIVQNLISGICTESGEDMKRECFEEGVKFIEERLESNFLQEFLSGPFYAKYQLEVLLQLGAPEGVVEEGMGRRSQPFFSTKDILANEELSFLFTEHLEMAGKWLFEFCLNVSHLRNLSAQGGPINQADAMVVYDKYISLQATTNLGFSASIRSKVEEKLCAKSGVAEADCFKEALQTALFVLDERYLEGFLASSNLTKYVAEVGKRASKQVKKRPGQVQRAGSTSSLNTCASSESSFNLSCQNTLLAASSGKRSLQGFSNFLDRYNTDATFLWKRKNYKVTNIGHVDHLGRYISNIAIPAKNPAGKPRTVRLSAYGDVPMSRKLSHAMKRLVISESEEKFREDMSWQVAEMIVNEVRSSLVKRK